MKWQIKQIILFYENYGFPLKTKCSELRIKFVDHLLNSIICNQFLRLYREDPLPPRGILYGLAVLSF